MGETGNYTINHTINKNIQVYGGGKQCWELSHLSGQSNDTIGTVSRVSLREGQSKGSLQIEQVRFLCRECHTLWN